MKQLFQLLIDTEKMLGLMLLAVLMVLGMTGNSLANKNTITVTGSTTVLPIAQSAAEVFMEKNTAVEISIQGGGSGVGIASIIDGACDIADASRPIKDKELDKAVSKGIDPKAHVIAMDGIAVVVNKSNSIEALSKQQLKDIFTGKISDWGQLGVSGGKIVAISRDSASGTFEAFNKLALDKARVRPDALMQASNQAVASVVAKTPGAIGYVGLGYLSPDLKALVIEGVIPSKATVLSGDYILSRPLFMYTNGEPTGHTKSFIDFILSDEGQKLVESLGYVGLK